MGFTVFNTILSDMVSSVVSIYMIILQQYIFHFKFLIILDKFVQLLVIQA